MAIEYVFDLERAVNTVEARVPGGKPAMKLLLTGGLLYGLLWVFRGLAIDFFLPLARVGISIISGTKPLPLSPSGILTMVVYAVAGAVLAASLWGIRHWSSKIRADVRALEGAIEKYRAMFWQPLTAAEKTELVAKLAKLEKYPVQISSNENPDCVELARDFRDCFRLAGWEVSDRHLTGAWGVTGATGIGVYANSDIVGDSFREELFTILIATQNLDKVARINRKGVSVSSDVTVWIVVGPKRLGV